jgi:hypothetical protein
MSYVTRHAIYQLNSPKRAVHVPSGDKSRYYVFVGQLMSADAGEQTIVLPLFGRKIPSCDRWEYFTSIKQYMIPVLYENKDCTVANVGCNKIRNGAHVTVPDYAGKVFVFRPVRY